ncbi:MAG TPA: hypothetical protein DCK98_00090 [Chloroflexi bacterium]|nr:hypothetical protein [Chloroflexota bacterium]HAL28107.1 hypothetical protein [Chloroflexota bacterium]
MDLGGVLAARLFRAAARGEEARRSEQHPRSNEDIAHAIEDIVPRLEGAGQAPALAAAMRRVAAMLRSNEDRFEGDMAELHVCHTCGRAMVGPAPDQCPSCGGGVLSFERVLPIYFLEPLPTEWLTATLAEFPERVAGVCRGVSEEHAGSGEWPLRDILSHLVGAQRLLAGRAVRTLEEDEPELRSIASTAVTVGAEHRPRAAELVAELRTGREELVGRFAHLTAEQWQRVGLHGEWGPITIQQQLSYLARHEHSHLGHLERAAEGR